MAQRRWELILAVTLVLSGCSAEDSSAPAPVPAHATVTAGAVQSGMVGAPLDSQLTVLVTDAGGKVLRGVRVTYTLPAGAGTLSDSAVTTTADGLARTRWILPGVAGTYVAVAKVTSLDSLTFSATATAGAPSGLVMLNGDPEGASAGAVLDTGAIVGLTDAFGNPLAGVILSVHVTAGGGSMPATVITDSAGRAVLRWTLGAVPGINRAAVNYTGISPLQLTAYGFGPLPTTRLAVADDHGCRIKSGGVAYCWGANGAGQLGTGDTVFRPVPTPVSTGVHFTSIGTGSQGLTCGLTADSTTYCWGALTGASSLAPVALTGPHFGRIAVGGQHACGVTGDHVAYCWGLNSRGQLGVGDVANRSTPIAVAGGHRFRQVEAAEQATCGLQFSGLVYCWGQDAEGQGGHGTASSANQLVPVAVNAATPVTELSAGQAHFCGLSFEGAPLCWGENFYGQSTAAAGHDPVPPTLITIAPAFVHLAVGGSQSCGLDAQGIATCWGRNNYLTLGDTIFGVRYQPQPVIGGHHFEEVHASTLAGCGVTTQDALYCWGTNGGAVGLADTIRRLTPMLVAGGHTFSAVSVGFRHSCGLDTQGQGFCWGDSFNWPLLGTGAYVPHGTPALVAGGHHFTRLRAGGYDTCALDQQGAAWCWGLGATGVVGDGTTNDQSIPTLVNGNHQFSEIDLGFSMACGLTTAGAVWCWGTGDVSSSSPASPVQVVLSEPVSSISVGTRMACGLGQSGAALCWNATGSTTSPVAYATSGTGAFTQVEAGSYNGCGLLANGNAQCWETLGDSSTVPVTVPGGQTYRRLELSYWGQAICGVTTSGTGYCWGGNPDGQLGTGSIDSVRTAEPVALAGGVSFQDLAISTFHGCGLATDGSAYCWGTSNAGSLGTGDLIFHPIPLLVQP